ncbi:MAG: DHA2 family efflux MFS transporter permease subunit [Proteobacteria bacterium]|nr:DHA2 family efflux MFS transporter permease subunit [Pseudomonadota bacterium]
MRRYFIFVTAGLGLLMHSIDSTIIAVAFPNFITELHTNVLWAAWTISVFFIGVAMAMPLAGSLSDTFGRKRVFLISLGLFTISSVACGLAPNIYALIGFRFLQGIGGAAFLPTASGIVSDAFPESRDRAIGLFTSIYPIGGIIGPNLGGWIVSKYSWRYIFYINLPIGLVLTGLIMVLLSDSKTFSRRHIDVAGASLMSGGLLFLMFALNIISESLSPASIFLAAVFLALSFSFLLFFLRQERKEAKPILDLTLLKSTPFLAANLLNMVLGAVIFGLYSFIPFYATSVHGLSTMMSGLILTPRSLGVIGASAVMSFLLRRYGYRWPMVLGFSIVSFGTIFLGDDLLWSAMGIRWGAAKTLSFLILIAGIGMGIMFPATNNACIELMPDKVATIVGLRNTFRTIGGALGVSVITFVLHLSSNPRSGFRIVFVSFALALMCAIPLVFLMPDGRKEWG